MIKSKLLLTISFSLLFLSSYAQQNTSDTLAISKEKIEPQIYLDSIKKSFVNHLSSVTIEKRWLSELTNHDLFEQMEQDLSLVDFDVTTDEFPELTTEILKERLEILNEKTPFNVQYNESLEKVIKSFLKNRKRSFERLLGLSEYYFPLFEEKLSQYDVPLEVKYLAIIESALNPTARSRVGATGLWQFMYATGKQYKLEVNSFVDDRIDPVKSSEAAAHFLSDLYQIFGDWDLVLASYNAGPGNVSKAIRRSQGYTNYWNIRQNLPRETQNYLPAFYATMYIFEFAEEHGISAIPFEHELVKTDTVALKKMISFEQLENILDVPKEEIEFLNPTYKLKVVPAIEGENNFIRLPFDKIGILVSNEDLIYDYLDVVNAQKEQPLYDIPTMLTESSATNNRFHTIRSGESVGVIAQKYGITVTQLKKFNGLTSNTIFPGKKLIVGRSTTAHAVTGGNVYVVKKGDSLYSISKKIAGLTINKLKSLNKLDDKASLFPGMKLRLK